MLTRKGSTWFGPIYQVWTPAICQTPLAICPQSNGTARIQMPEWGGRRKGAGRKAKGPRAFVSHKARPRFEKPAAVLVTLRVASQVRNLRSRRCFRVIEEGLPGRTVATDSWVLPNRDG